MDYLLFFILSYYCYMAKLTEEDIELKNNIKRRFNIILSAKNLKQNELANISLKDRQAINRWTNLKNDRGLTIYTISQLCKVLNISLKEFFDDPLFTKETISKLEKNDNT